MKRMKIHLSENVFTIARNVFVQNAVDFGVGKKMGSVSYCIIENWWTESKFWICFFQSNGSKCGLFSISLSPFCLRNVLMESAFVLLQIWSLFSSCSLVQNQRLRSYSNKWLNFMSAFNPIYSLWAFFVPNENAKNTSKDAIQIWFNLSQSYHPYIPDMYMQLN